MSEKELGVIIVISLLLFFTQILFEFKFDFTNDGEMLLWYNSNDGRKFKKIF